MLRPAPFLSLILCAGVASAAALNGGLWREIALLVASGSQPDQRLGWDVALDGDTAAASMGPGSPAGRSVEVWVHGMAGWAREATLLPQSGSLGGAVALQGDRLVAGDAYHDNGRGRLLVFGRSGTSWTELQVLQHPTGLGQSNLYGFAAALDGGDLAVGAPTQFEREGSVWTYRWNGATYAFLQTLAPADEPLSFGWDVALDAGRLVAGAPSYTIKIPFNNITGVGAVYIYERSTSGSWVESQFLLDDTLPAGSFFGSSVALEGDTLVIGIPGVGTAAGAVRVYQHDGASFVLEQELTPSDAAAGRNFGADVDLCGDLLLIGAPGRSPAFAPEGAAYLFRREGVGWVELEKLTSSSAVLDGFGTEVALDGTLVLAGAPYAGAGQEGEAQLLEPGPPTSAVRNAGANPRTYDAGLLALGATWTATVDVAASGHDTATVFVFPGPTQVLLSHGQVLLGAGKAIIKLPLLPGPIATWSLMVPADPGLLGLCVTTQGALFGHARPFALTNAVDLVASY